DVLPELGRKRRTVTGANPAQRFVHRSIELGNLQRPEQKHSGEKEQPDTEGFRPRSLACAN
ncbi:MAG: hypothetical protein V3U68_01690, partial [Bacteroidota bacterium]